MTSGLFRDTGVRVALGFFVLTLIAGAIVTPWHHRLAATGGLGARYFAGNDVSRPPALETIDREITDLEIRPHRATVPAPDVTIRWSGYVIAPSAGTYRFWVPPCLQEFMLDRRLVASDGMPTGGPPTLLTRGLHAVEMSLACEDVPREFHIEWARPGDPGNDIDAFRTIPTLLLVPEVRDHNEVRARQGIARIGSWMPVLWLVSVAGLVAAFARRLVRGNQREQLPRLVAATLLVAIPVFAAGVWWGIPDVDSWAADEVGPGDVGYAVAARFGFSQHWATIYPPLHYAVLAAAYLPFRIADSLQLITLQDAATLSGLLIVGRLVSTLMALGTVWTVYLMTAESFNRRAGALAAAAATLSAPMIYYSKTANLDVPYVFWLVLGLRFWLRSAASNDARDFYLFALFATLTVCTKDQSYGYFVLPALYIAVGQALTLRGSARLPGTPPLPVLWRMSAIAAVTFAAVHGLPFNWQGFLDHVRLAIDAGGEQFSMVRPTAAGYATLTWKALQQLGNAMSWPLFAASVCGIAIALRAPRTPHDAPSTSHPALRTSHSALLLLLPLLSYYLFFVCVVRYHYDRFFLGYFVLLAVFAGVALDWVLTRAVRYRVAAAGLVVLVLGYALTRAVAIDLYMVRDSRYDAERWLRAHVQPRQRVMGVGFYQPRKSIVPWTALKPGLDLLAAESPDVVLVNADFARRSRTVPEQQAFYTGLADGTAGYERAADFRTALTWPFNLDLHFGQDIDAGFSNLTKINPPIVIYTRKGGSGR